MLAERSGLSKERWNSYQRRKPWVNRVGSGGGEKCQERLYLKESFKDNVFLQTIHIYFCPTEDMAADILTKPLQRVAFQKHRRQLGVLDLVA